MPKIDNGDVTEGMLFARIGYVITRALACLTAEELAERVAWCRENGQPGCSVHEGPDGSAHIAWAGRELASIARSSLATADAYLTEAPDWTLTADKPLCVAAQG